MSTLQLLIIGLLTVIWILSSIHNSRKRRQELQTIKKFSDSLLTKFQNSPQNVDTPKFEKKNYSNTDTKTVIQVSESVVYTKQVVRTLFDTKKGHFYSDTSPASFIAVGRNMTKDEFISLLEEREKRDEELERKTLKDYPDSNLTLFNLKSA